MVQGKINTGRHSDHPAGRHSIWTNHGNSRMNIQTCEVKAEKMMRVRKMGTVIMMSLTTSTSSSSYSPPQLTRALSRKNRAGLTDSLPVESNVEHFVRRGRQWHDIVPDHRIDMNLSTRPSPVSTCTHNVHEMCQRNASDDRDITGANTSITLWGPQKW